MLIIMVKEDQVNNLHCVIKSSYEVTESNISAIDVKFKQYWAKKRALRDTIIYEVRLDWAGATPQRRRFTPNTSLFQIWQLYDISSCVLFDILYIVIKL